MINDTDRISEALQSIDPRDRDIWVRIAMAIKSEVGDLGFDLWDTWSQQAESYNARDAEDVWKSIHINGTVTIATLFHHAKQNGWAEDGSYQKPTSEEQAERQRMALARAAKDEADIAIERANTAAKATAILKAAAKAQADHPYLSRKQIPPVDTLREIDANAAAAILGYAPKSGGEILAGRLLVVPIKQGNGLSSVELIDGDSRKTALAGRGSKAGGYWASERMPVGDGQGLTLLIGEGVATALSAKEASGYPAIAALSAGNLSSVAMSMRTCYPSAAVVILADLNKSNGEADPRAIEAARNVGGLLAKPDFGSPRDTNMTDFNDLWILDGAEAVRNAITNATPVALNETQAEIAGAHTSVATSNEWREPQPLSAKIEREPYPINALPSAIRAAVEEVAGFVKAPLPLVATSALAALSLAAQSHFDVRRAEKLSGPVGLFLLTIAESGERKSTCDGFFSRPVRDYEARQAEEAKPILKDYRAAFDTWEAKRAGIKEQIRQLAKNSKSTTEMETVMRNLEHEAPDEPKVPRLLYADVTPEALAWGLAKHWPSGGVVSAEAGTVFGSHGMSGDSVMRNMATLNQLWDGNDLNIDRKTSESFIVRGARLTVALQVQEPTLRAFFDKSGALARGTGFLARFLVAWPQSTQGQRPFTDAPADWPHLTEFHRRIAAILAQPAPINEDGVLVPGLLSLTQEAKEAWVSYHDTIEGELGSGGELHEVSDVASKSADNAARLAALFQVFEHGFCENVEWDSMDRATTLAAWHLHEARRFFGEIAMPAELADAARLDHWLIEYGQRNQVRSIGKNYVRQHGPLRDGKRLDAAIQELDGMSRVRLVKDSKRQSIQINPALLVASQ